MSAVKNLPIHAEGSIPSADRRRILHGLRVGWLALAICLFAVFLISIPGTYRMLQTPCPPDTTCATIWQATPARLAQLNQMDISVQTIALYVVVLYTLVSLVFWAVGLLIYWHRSEHWFALLTAHLMVLLAAGGPPLIFVSGLVYSGVPAILPIVIGCVVLPVYQFISLFFILFPNGNLYLTSCVIKQRQHSHHTWIDRFLTAFAGNRGSGKICLAFPKVKYVFCDHTH